MSRLSRAARQAELLHERARLLVSEAIDTELEPGDAAWLAEHLDGCPDCRTVADEYRALREELRSLAVPEPPRDLWARTTAALDEVERSAPRKAGAIRQGFGGWAATRSSFGAAVAVALVVVISGVSLLSQVPASHVPGSTRGVAVVPPAPLSAEAPVAVVDGTGYWITRDGQTYQIRAGSAKCSGPSDRCSVSSESGTTIGSITSDSPVFAALAPDARQAAVWNGDTVAILPLVSQTPATVAIDQMTPRPTTTDSAVATFAQPAPTVTATSTASASISATPGSTGTAVPSESPTASAPASPGAFASVSPSPSLSSPPAQPVTVPTAILNGYKVVGRAPEFSPDGQWVAFSAAPTNFTNGPDLFVWQVGQERAHAVTSAHVDFFSGWLGSEILVSELSASPAVSSPAATSSDVLTPAPSDSSSPSASASASPSAEPPSGPTTTSYLFDPATGNAQRIDRAMLLPVSDPTGTFLVYWSGTIVLDAVSGQLKAGTGNLYLDSWADLKLEPALLDGVGALPTATPTAATTGGEPSASPTPVATTSTEAAPSPTPSSVDNGNQTPSPEPSAAPVLPELLRASAVDSVENWVVEWDATGQHVAVWVADPSSQSVGVVNLFAIDRGSGLVATDGPLFHARGLSSIQFDNGRLIYTTPAEGSDGKTYLVPLPSTPPTPSPSPSPSPSPTSSAAEAPSHTPTITPQPTAPPSEGPGS